MLELRSINVFIGPVHVLHNLTLTIGERETVALVGRNGAGKSTTAKAIIGLLPVRSGSVTYRGTEITKVPAHERAKLGIGYSPEDARVFPDLTVQENLKIAMWLAGSNAATNVQDGLDPKVERVFPEIKRLLRRRGLYCSGGEKKIVSLGRALSLNPSLLVLDEAFEGLAPVVVNRFFQAIQEIKQLGISMLIAESNVAIAARMADRLYAIDRGEIIYEGTPQHIFELPEVIRTIRGY